MEDTKELLTENNTETNSGSRAIIISGGTIDREQALELFKENKYRYIVGADAGLRFLYSENIVPTHIVGDFDSLGSGSEILDSYMGNPNIVIRIFNPVKDKTDTEIAIRLCLELGAEDITILGWNGARVDHTIGNLQSLMAPLKAGIPCVLKDVCNEVRIVDGETKIRKSEAFGKYLSLFPFAGSVGNLTVEGVKYPLKGHTLLPNDSLGVSNEITDEVCRISFDRGILLVIMSKDRDH